MFRTTVAIAVCLAGSFLSLDSIRALAAEQVNHTRVLGPFVNDDTFAAAYVDAGPINVAEQARRLLQLLPKASGDAESWTPGITMADGLVRQFQQAGGQGIYVVVGLADVHTGGGPLAIATVRPGQQPEKVERLVRDHLQQLGDNQLDVQRKGDAVLIGTKATVARYATLKSAARSDLVEPLAKLTGDGALAAAVFCPGPDFRRVVRELWPELPGMLAPLKGELADRWLHVEAAINAPPDAKPRLVLQAKDTEAAEVFAKLWRGLPTATAQFGGNEKSRQQLKGHAQLLVDSLPVKVDGTRVEISVSTDAAQFANLLSLVGTAADKSMESSQRSIRMNQFKQLLLAMLNFHDNNKHFPPAAICGKDGKPLLSWRVAILPFIEEGDLYKQFHLDEPWDSPHNRPLVEKMPAVYADPDRKLKQLAREGKTTFQVPAGKETVFHDNVGTSFREITDGTSQTIALVEVTPQRAVIWTKPEDWEVDLAHARQGVERSDRDFFVAARCDGSAHAVPVNIDEKTLRALLTRAGGEVIDRP